MRFARYLPAVVIWALLIAAPWGCKKKAEAPKPPPPASDTKPAPAPAPVPTPAASPAQDLLKDLKVSHIPDATGSRHVTQDVAQKSTGIELFYIDIDDIRNRLYTSKEYEKSAEKIGNYPAKVEKDNIGNPRVSVLVKNAIEVSVTAKKDAPAAAKDPEFLKKALLLIDLAGLEKQDLKKDELDGKADLQKYLPKLQ
jgi:hypothetical protein